eukprot:10011970-Prorocentrum_lima.AAC.1
MPSGWWLSTTCGDIFGLPAGTEVPQDFRPVGEGTHHRHSCMGGVPDPGLDLPKTQGIMDVGMKNT